MNKTLFIPGLLGLLISTSANANYGFCFANDWDGNYVVSQLFDTSARYDDDISGYPLMKKYGLADFRCRVTETKSEGIELRQDILSSIRGAEKNRVRTVHWKPN